MRRTHATLRIVPEGIRNGMCLGMCPRLSMVTALSAQLMAQNIPSGGGWDMIIAFPPCTYMTNASAVRMRVKGVIQEDRYRKAMEAKAFFMQFYNADCPRIAIENPTPLRIIGLPAYSQVIQPYMFGHPYSKRTCLWLKGLPPLIPTDLVAEYEPFVNGGCKDAHGQYRRFQGRNERDPKTRSKTFTGVAHAMAEQWG